MKKISALTPRHKRRLYILRLVSNSKTARQIVKNAGV